MCESTASSLHAYRSGERGRRQKSVIPWNAARSTCYCESRLHRMRDLRFPVQQPAGIQSSGPQVSPRGYQPGFLGEPGAVFGQEPGGMACATAGDHGDQAVVTEAGELTLHVAGTGRLRCEQPEQLTGIHQAVLYRHSSSIDPRSLRAPTIMHRPRIVPCCRPANLRRRRCSPR